MTTQHPPLNVLHVAATLSPSPQATGLLRLAQQSTDQHHIAYVACPKTPMIEALLRAGGVHIACSFEGAGSLLRGFLEGYRLAAHVRRNNIDILHAHDARTYKAALWAGRFTKTPVVLTVTTPEHNTPARKASGIVVESRFMAELLNLKNTHVCPPSYDPLILNTKEIDAKAVDTLWSEWDVPAATTVILITEPLTEDSGYRLLIEALGSMRKLPFKAIICANYAGNPLFTELWRRIDSLGLGKQILFINQPENLADMKNILAASDVVVFPNSTPTAESQSVLNAQAMGNAVIVCTQTSRAELVKSGETGWRINLTNEETAPQKLALALTDAITDVTRLQKMGITATRHCKEHHQNAAIYADLFAFYQTLRNPEPV